MESELPRVTYDGVFMRGRLGSGILRRLQLQELIAADKTSYVEVAVRLGLDDYYRENIRGKLGAAAARAYEDAGAVRALERVLLG